MKSTGKIILKSIAAICLAAMLFSCKNDIQTIRELDLADSIPANQAWDIEMLYSERGQVKIKLVSPSLITHGEKQDILEFPKGFMVYFYDTALQVKSTIQADYGISTESNKLMEARYNVIVRNLEKNEILNTEQLFWDRDKARIYTDKAVRITRGEEIITGDGLTSDQTFEDVVIQHPKGLIELKEEEATPPGTE